MQVAGDKAAILGVSGGVSSAKAGAETIGVVKVGAEVGIKVSAEVRIATVREIGKTRTGSIVGVFGGFEVGIRGFKVEVGSSGKQFQRC
jgi:hypothetical protein